MATKSLTGLWPVCYRRAVEWSIHYEDLQSPRPCAVAIGSFDGLHLGHQHLIQATREAAAARNLDSAVLTFEPHPARALAPGFSPPLLMPPARRRRAFAGLCLDRVLSQRFDREFAALRPEEFAERVLSRSLRAEFVTIGDDFTFGCNRSGRVDDLIRLGGSLGFEVQVVERLAIEGMIASSTRIRAFLLQGRVRAAALLLGRPHAIAGRVVHGKARGRTLGYPTANLATEDEVVPARGVYLCHAWGAGWPYGRLAVTNIGTNPTFGQGPQTIETHILDLDADLFDQPLALCFRERLRAEMVFSSPAELVAQIDQDVERARELGGSFPDRPHLDPHHGIDLDTARGSPG